ncbi:MAG TPA: LuxR C-terminal-related transcriptional regulator [Gammaproteobacteria bacterium]|nr:LuxR C-terminal-related transcriptional regulator [Gammaproteobacteria bacterium]
MIRVLLVDPRKLMRAGLKTLMEEEGRIAVVAEAEIGDEAIRLAQEHRPDAVLVDTRITSPGILETVRRLLRIESGNRVMALGDPDCGPLPVRILELGASGYLSKHTDGAELRRAVLELKRGKRYVCAEVARHLVLNTIDSQGDPVGVLSPRELSVMLMLSEGHPRDEISNRLCISVKTVSTYRTRLLQKLGARNDVDLTHLALRHGLLAPPPRIGA